MAVLISIVKTKAGDLEILIFPRRKEATKFTDLDRLCLLAQCGFAWAEEGNILAQHEQMGEATADRRDRQEIWD
jgi:hypothetical protein